MQLLEHKKIWWLGFSGTLLLISIIALGIWKLKPGLDFAGGTNLELRITNKELSIIDIEKSFENLKLDHLVITKTDQGFLIKTAQINQETKNEILEKSGGEEIRFETVGPTVSKDLIQKSISAVVVASITIVVYLAYSFRKANRQVSSWRFGLTAIAALIHDLLITIGAFAAAGHFLGYEIDSLFITALLTVLGFSVHDTIVVFDRLRENLQLNPNADFESIANASLIQTIGRSINTSMTVILVLASMYLLGGETIKPFVFALLVGITVGTYSSIFVATPLLVIWQKYKK